MVLVGMVEMLVSGWVDGFGCGVCNCCADGYVVVGSAGCGGGCGRVPGGCGRVPGGCDGSRKDCDGGQRGCMTASQF